MDKVVLAGTHRVRTPEQTLEIITPRLGDYGVTRLADVTGLDSLEIPVVMAVRPLAATLSVAQGKGATLALAKVSAAMECIEFWHAERTVPDPAAVGVPAAELSLGYQVTDLEQEAGSLLTDHSVLDWIQARSAVDGRETLVPRTAVQIGRFSRDDWTPGTPSASTNGLASGNTRAEALVHALYEVIERDAGSRLQLLPVDERSHLDPDSVTGYCAELIGRVRAAGAWLELVVAPNRFDVPCFAAYLWREDFFGTAAGAGAHSDPAVALSRAVTEAAQSRLTAIAGTRDDQAPRVYGWPTAAVAQPVTPPGALDWGTLAADFSRSFPTDDGEAAWLARHVADVTGADPVVVDLCTGEICVVKVLCPGLANTVHHDLARPAAGPS
jgi:ribosomal protein S12 methylthiotransferase accessory factor